MEKITFTAADGTLTDYFPQSYTDAAGTAALAGTAKATITEVDVIESDGTEVKLTPSA